VATTEIAVAVAAKIAVAGTDPGIAITGRGDAAGAGIGTGVTAVAPEIGVTTDAAPTETARAAADTRQAMVDPGSEHTKTGPTAMVALSTANDVDSVTSATHRIFSMIPRRKKGNHCLERQM
jgi:hypothetical protein